jgi:hypothetical protein
LKLENVLVVVITLDDLLLMGRVIRHGPSPVGATPVTGALGFVVGEISY